MQFALLLARTLGRTFHEICETVTAQEFALWLAEYAREPWGEVRSDLRAGIVASTVANFAGRQLPRDAEAKRPSDYMPFLDVKKPAADGPQESPGEWVARLKGAKAKH